MQKITKIKVSKFNFCDLSLSRISQKLYSLDASNSIQPKNDTPLDKTLSKSKQLHKPVMLHEVIEHLVNITGQLNTFESSNKVKLYNRNAYFNFKFSNFVLFTQIYLDMTFGAGGHSKEILNKSPNSILYALDRDPLAYGLANKLSIEFK